MSSLSARLSLLFSSIGHTYTHLIMMLWPTVVLVLENSGPAEKLAEQKNSWMIGTLFLAQRPNRSSTSTTTSTSP